MLQREILLCGSLAVLLLSTAPGLITPGLITPALAEDSKTSLFKIVTVKDEIVIGLSTDELKALGGTDASAVAHALAQKGDMAVWQYNVHRGANGELPTCPVDPGNSFLTSYTPNNVGTPPVCIIVPTTHVLP